MRVKSLLMSMTVGAGLLAAQSVAADVLLEQQKSSYKDEGTLIQLSKDPESMLKSKLKMSVVFLSWTKDLPKGYAEFLSDRSVVIITEDNSQDKYKQNVPVIIANNIDALKEELAKMQPGKQILLYGTIKMSKQSKDEKTKTPASTYFYFNVEEIDPVPVIPHENPTDFKEADYQQVLPRYMDLQPASFMNKKICFDITFKDIAPALPPVIMKNTAVSDETAFQFLPGIALNTPLIADRLNESCVKAFAGAEKDSKLKLFGILKKTNDPTKLKLTPVYYFWIVKAVLQGKLEASMPQLPPPPPAPVEQPTPPAPTPAAEAVPVQNQEAAPQQEPAQAQKESNTPQKDENTQDKKEEQPKKDGGLQNILDKLDMK